MSTFSASGVLYTPNIAYFGNYGMESRWTPDGIQQKSINGKWGA
jgi:hypothetical protein